MPQCIAIVGEKNGDRGLVCTLHTGRARNLPPDPLIALVLAVLGRFVLVSLSAHKIQCTACEAKTLHLSPELEDLPTVQALTVPMDDHGDEPVQ